MRRFEYVGRSSEKFWEIDRQGTEVTVTFGRIGTTGQTQVKELGSEDAAKTHVDKLIAEKVKKGYVETQGPSDAGTRRVPPNRSAGAGTTSAKSPPVTDASVATAEENRSQVEVDDRDEDLLVLPSGWRRSIHPRRGGTPGPALTVNRERTAATVDQLLGGARGTITAALGHPKTHPSIARAVRGALGEGERTGLLRRSKATELTPAGAAGVALLLGRHVRYDETSMLADVADLWVTDHGLAFAAAAAAETAAIALATDDRAVGPTTAFYLVAAGASGTPQWWSSTEVLLERMRRHMAAADDDAHARAVAALQPLRNGPIGRRVVVSYLVTGQGDWVEEDSKAVARAAAPHADLLLASVTTGAQVKRVAGSVSPWQISRATGLLYSLAEGVGAAAAPVVAQWFDTPNFDADAKKRLLAILAVLPSDQAFSLLIERADQKYVQASLIEAVARFPRRSMRLLAEATGRPGAIGRIATDLLRGHVLANAALAASVAPSLSPEARRAVDGITADRVATPSADPAALPDVLISPPWTTKRAIAKPAVVDGLRAPGDARISWAPGERDRWSARRGYGGAFRTGDWNALLEDYKKGQLRYQEMAFFGLAPADLTRPYLGGFRPRDLWYADAWLERIVAVHELVALPLALHAATSNPSAHAALLLPFESTEIALLMADWYVRLKSVRSTALGWLGRHADAAAASLIPTATGKPGKGRKSAEAALRALRQLGHEEAVMAAARGYGAAAEAVVAAVLAADPLAILPPRMPTLPACIEPALLPAVLLADRTASLPPDSVRHVCTMLAISRPGEVYAGVDVVKQTCDPASLAELGWALFQRWESAGMPSKEGWVMDALGIVGDDETVRRLAPLIRAWPGEGGHARAVSGLDVLAAIGTDVALLHLHGISEKVKFKGLRGRAAEKIAEVAAGLDLTPEQLADRLVPDLGLDADGSMTLDYGPRRFRVGFDEQLKPYVADEDGTRRKDLPKPGSRDDATLAPDAYKRFSALKKDVRTIAADQIRRLERAMVAQRRWDAAQLRSLFIDHPLLWHISRRLVWAVFDNNRPGPSFRVAEDRTLADIHDNELQLPVDATVGIPHPLHLADEVGTWSDLFADYEILQPFPQLGRDTYRLTEAERAAPTLTRFTGVKVETVKVLGLERFGWERGEAMDAGIQGWMHRPIGDGRSVVAYLDPGIIAGAATEWKEQTIQEVIISNAPDDWYGRGKSHVPFGELDDVTSSEVIRDLQSLTG
ncbi:MAG: DUF4132 domain-containing protein [Actinomycetota bacterium]|nr:DUF4132 domain-containing protein [Actinomycetota bacterium]